MLCSDAMVGRHRTHSGHGTMARRGRNSRRNSRLRFEGTLERPSYRTRRAGPDDVFRSRRLARGPFAGEPPELGQITVREPSAIGLQEPGLFPRRENAARRVERCAAPVCQILAGEWKVDRRRAPVSDRVSFGQAWQDVRHTLLDSLCGKLSQPFLGLAQARANDLHEVDGDLRMAMNELHQSLLTSLA